MLLAFRLKKTRASESQKTLFVRSFSMWTNNFCAYYVLASFSLLPVYRPLLFPEPPSSREPIVSGSFSKEQNATAFTFFCLYLLSKYAEETWDQMYVIGAACLAFSTVIEITQI